MTVPDWHEIQKTATIVDLHIHPSMQQQIFQRNLNARYVMNRTIHGNPMSVRASFPRLRDGGYDVILSTLHIPERGLQKDFPIIKIFRYLRPGLWNKLIAAPPFKATLSIMADFEKAVANTQGYEWTEIACSVKALDEFLEKPKGHRPIIAIHAVEGGHSLGLETTSAEGALKNVETLFERGVACLTLAHFYPNLLVHPTYPFPDDVAKLSVHPNMWRDLTQGLTETGKQVVEKMIQLGMMIDISHSTPIARKEVYDIIDASGRRVPLLATHVGAYELDPTPYNLTDWEIKRIARDGGVIGVIFMPYWLMPKESAHGLDAVSQHMQYLVKVGGEDCVGIGTDFDGFATPPEDLDNASRMPRLTQRLVADGHREVVIRKILGENAIRALHEGWGRKT